MFLARGFVFYRLLKDTLRRGLSFRRRVNTVNGARHFLRVVIHCRSACVLVLRFPSGLLGVFCNGQICANGQFVRRSGFEISNRTAYCLHATALTAKRLNALILARFLWARLNCRALGLVFLVVRELVDRFGRKNGIILRHRLPRGQDFLNRVSSANLNAFMGEVFYCFGVVRRGATFVQDGRSCNRVRQDDFPNAIQPRRAGGLTLLRVSKGVTRRHALAMLFRRIFDAGRRLTFFRVLYCFTTGMTGVDQGGMRLRAGVQIVVGTLEAINECVVLVKQAFSHPRHVHVFFQRCVGRVRRLKMGSVNVILLVSFFVKTIVAVRVGLGVRDP